MKERPILFNGPMVRAILEGRKMQTRRSFNERTMKLLKLAADAGEVSNFASEGCLNKNDQKYIVQFCTYGQPGDRLWVRETWSTHACFDAVPPAQLTTRSLHYWADGKIETGKGRPSIHMPRWASRITLEITRVRVERLQDISEADALVEGITFNHAVKPSRAERMARDSYADLWESINGPGSWDANPWVWVVEFKRVEGGAA